MPVDTGGASSASGSRDAMAGMGCYQVCLEGDPESLKENATWVYKGEGHGSYIQNTSMDYIGPGAGAYEKEVHVTYGAFRCRTCCIFLLLLVPILSLLAFWLWPRRTPAPAQAEAFNCFADYENWRNAWNEAKANYCCEKAGRGCPQPEYPEYHKFEYNCHSGYSNWFFGWSTHKKSWCCDHKHLGCPGTWHGSYHLHTNILHGVGHAHGRIYDCHAGFSNWKQGWSDSKKDWCCSHEKKGCLKYHCHSNVGAWAAPKREWCCSNFQVGCPHTTLSADKCDAQCVVKGESSKCISRIHWTRDNVFSGKENGCELAYSKVQVECDICRACTIQEAGCKVHAVAKDPFDCNAALNNFFRAWSPDKKHWCCTKRGKGCAGSSPPAVDAGFGMVWKRVQEEEDDDDDDDDVVTSTHRCMGIGPGKRCMDMVSSACLTIAKRDFTIGTPDGLQERRDGAALISIWDVAELVELVELVEVLLATPLALRKTVWFGIGLEVIGCRLCIMETCPTTATRDWPIGVPGGPSPRRTGAATMWGTLAAEGQRTLSASIPFHLRRHAQIVDLSRLGHLISQRSLSKVKQNSGYFRDAR